LSFPDLSATDQLEVVHLHFGRGLGIRKCRVEYLVANSEANATATIDRKDLT